MMAVTGKREKEKIARQTGLNIVVDSSFPQDVELNGKAYRVMRGPGGGVRRVVGEKMPDGTIRHLAPNEAREVKHEMTDKVVIPHQRRLLER
ncbi:MAG: hypothetical protein JRN54_04515, partial [Nitrososphaerota archaeon]|nr:hypothetical protein [Nitrososphaerota archaeon]